MKKYIITVYLLVDDFCQIFKGSKKQFTTFCKN
jgi:hypothetical protein